MAGRLGHDLDGLVPLVVREVQHDCHLIDLGVHGKLCQGLSHRFGGDLVFFKEVLRRVGAGKAHQIEQRRGRTRAGLHGILQDFEGGRAPLELHGYPGGMGCELRISWVGFENGQVMLKSLAKLSGGFKMERSTEMRQNVRPCGGRWRNLQVRCICRPDSQRQIRHRSGMA